MDTSQNEPPVLTVVGKAPSAIDPATDKIEADIKNDKNDLPKQTDDIKVSNDKKPKEAAIMTVDIETTGNADVTKYGIIALGIFVGNLEGKQLHKSRICFNIDEEVELIDSLTFFLYEYLCSLYAISLSILFLVISFAYSYILFSLLTLIFLAALVIVLVGRKVDPKKVFEPRCKNEFWSKNKKQLEEFLKNMMYRSAAIDSYLQILDEFDEKYDLKIISDNLSFDIAFINYYVGKYSSSLKSNSLHSNVHLQIYELRMPIHFVQSGPEKNKYRGIDAIEEYILKHVRKVLKLDTWTWDQKKIDAAVEKIEVVHDHWPENDAEHIYREILATLNVIKESNLKTNTDNDSKK